MISCEINIGTPSTNNHSMQNNLTNEQKIDEFRTFIQDNLSSTPNNNDKCVLLETVKYAINNISEASSSNLNLGFNNPSNANSIN